MFIYILCAALFLFGFIGCFVSKIPGPLLAVASLLLFVFVGDTPLKLSFWIILLLIVLALVSMYLSYKVLPKLSNKIAEFGKAGNWGCLVGSVLGLLFLFASENPSAGYIIFCLILTLAVLPFLFALLFEFFSRKDMGAALKAAGGATFNYFLDTVLQLAVCAYCFYLFYDNLSL